MCRRDGFTAVDSKGRPVENYEGDLTIDVEGEANVLALDNGDHFTNRNLEAAVTSLYRGGALLILRATRNGGKVKIKASVPGMKSIKLLLETKCK